MAGTPLSDHMAHLIFPTPITRERRSIDDTPRTVDPFERALFDSARADEVPDEARARAALALGIGTPAGGNGPGAPEGASGAPGEGHPSWGTSSRGSRKNDPAAQGVSGKLVLAGKAAVVGLASGLAALMILSRSSDGPATSPPATAPSAQRSVAHGPDDAPSRTEAAATPLEPSAALPAATRLAAEPASAHPAVAREAARSDGRANRGARPEIRPARNSAAGSGRDPAASGASRLLAEVARLDQARAALAASDVERVMRHIERYRNKFPNGALTREAARLEARARALESGSASRARDIGEAR
jgi:hypothetical protein